MAHPLVGILTLARQHRRLLVGAFFLMLVNRLTALSIPIGAKYLIDDIVSGAQTGHLLGLMLAVASGLALETVSGYHLAFVTGTGAQRAITTLRSSLQSRMIQLPVTFFEDSQSGVLSSRIMSDPEGVRSLLGTGLVQIAGGVLTSVAALIFLASLDWRLAAGVAVALVVYVIALMRGLRALYSAFLSFNERTAALTGRMTEMLSGITIVKTYVAEHLESQAFARDARDLCHDFARATGIASMLTAVSTLLTGLLILATIAVGGPAVMAHSMTLGTLTMGVLLAGLVTGPLTEAAAYSAELGKATAAFSRMNHLYTCTTEDEYDRARQASSVTTMNGAVEFVNVFYAYRTGRRVLCDVSFAAAPGTTIALVGRSGSGKSTICRLLLALDAPTQGRVLIDDNDLTQLRRHDYRARLGVVPQEGFLFNGTVADNIRYGRLAATLSEVQHAACIAHCAEFISALPDGYDTVVGERGVRLSGGQRQRLAIARAVLRDPTLLILDEATSNLDTESEWLIQDALRTLIRGRTTFVIAHRLSTVRYANQILVLDAGRVIERGTHDELLTARGLYRRLFDTQYWTNGTERPVPGVGSSALFSGPPYGAPVS